mmetsp:Transcript_4778/g.10770  ORF Transcript_4778/g.10770 Transcript_4778/m.10770 type:complete len:84 (-) Transcript_4778:131-382(-)
MTFADPVSGLLITQSNNPISPPRGMPVGTTNPVDVVELVNKRRCSRATGDKDAAGRLQPPMTGWCYGVLQRHIESKQIMTADD